MANRCRLVLARATVCAAIILSTVLGACMTERSSPIDASTRARSLSILRAGLAADAFWPSLHAAEALTLEGHALEVRDALLPRLARETDDQRRCGLARELFRAGDKGTVQVLLDILASENPRGHLHAAESLFKVRQQGDGTALRDALAQTADPRLQVMAAGALTAFGDPEARILVRAALSRDDQLVVRTAAWLLGELRDGSDVEALRGALAHSADPLTRAFIENALASLQAKGSLQILERNLSSADPVIRVHAAATAAGGARNEEIAALLAQRLDDPDLDVRIRSAQAVLDIARRGVGPFR